MRYLIALLALSLLLPRGVSAQSGTWCRSFDFRSGPDGWTLSYPDAYGRYNTNVGFTVRDYFGVGELSYEQQGSIRIHRDFSGTLTQLFIYARNPDYDTVFIDYNSLVSDAEPLDDDVFQTGGASPAGISLNPTTVTNRLGLELVKTTAPVPAQMIIIGIVLVGNGSNPFGENNCVGSTMIESAGGEGSDQPYEASFDGPFPEIFAGLAEANNAIDQLPVDLLAPDGVSILPSTDGNQIFAYAKWLISPAAADEYAGPFAPIIQHQGILVTGMFVMIGVYLLVYIVVYGLRFVLWLAIWTFRLFDLVLQVLQAGGSIIVNGATALLRAVSR